MDGTTIECTTAKAYLLMREVCSSHDSHDS